VIHLSLDGLKADTVDVFMKSLNGKLRAVAQRHWLEIDGDNPTDLVKSLIRRLSRRHEERTGERFGMNVVVLVDEYDAPVLDHAADDDLALAIHSDLDHFYTVLKSLENYIRFLFITGGGQVRQ
jgi:hypothetical protein